MTAEKVETLSSSNLKPIKTFPTSNMTFSDSALRLAIALNADDIGFHAIHSTALASLTDTLNYYLSKLSVSVHRFSNHAGRTEPTIDDVRLAYQSMNIDTQQMTDFISNVEPSQFPVKIPFYPLPCRRNRLEANVDEDEERPE